MSVLVIGNGLAGTVAAISARNAGADVVVVGASPGASAMWSGVAEVYGPAYDSIDYQTRLGTPHMYVAGRPPLEEIGQRFERLRRRRSLHPYARLGLEVDDVKLLVGEANVLLGEPVVLADSPTYVANAAGMVRMADGAAPSVWAGRLDLERKHIVCGFEHYPSFSPEATARQLQWAGVPADPFWVQLSGAPLSQLPAVAASFFEAIHTSELDALARQIAVRIADGMALVPPIMGRTPESHARIVLHLTQEASYVAELAGLERSLHGARLSVHLRTALEQAGCDVRRDLVTEVRHSNGSLVSATTRKGDEIEVSAVVLATGRALSGGFRRVAPLTEALFKLPLYLEGTPLEPEDLYPAQLTTRRWLDDHPLFRVGVGVDEHLRPLGLRAEAVYDNLFAAGLVLGGTDFTRDGSAFGVGLATGLLAGKFAAGGE